MIDIDKILLEIEKFIPEYDNQISLQGVLGNVDPSYGTGRLEKLNHDEPDFTNPLFPDMVYTNNIIKQLGKVFNMRKLDSTNVDIVSQYQCNSGIIEKEK